MVRWSLLARSVGWFRWLSIHAAAAAPASLFSFLAALYGCCGRWAYLSSLSRGNVEDQVRDKEWQQRTKGIVVSLSCGMPLASDKGRRVEYYWIISLSDYYAIFLVNSQISATLTGLLKPFENSLFTLLLSSCSHNLFAKF